MGGLLIRRCIQHNGLLLRGSGLDIRICDTHLCTRLFIGFESPLSSLEFQLFIGVITPLSSIDVFVHRPMSAPYLKLIGRAVSRHSVFGLVQISKAACQMFDHSIAAGFICRKRAFLPREMPRDSCTCHPRASPLPSKKVPAAGEVQVNFITKPILPKRTPTTSTFARRCGSVAPTHFVSASASRNLKS